MDLLALFYINLETPSHISESILKKPLGEQIILPNMTETKPLDYIPHSGGRDQDKGKLYPKFYHYLALCVYQLMEGKGRILGWGVTVHVYCGTNLCVHNLSVNVALCFGEDLAGGCPICWEVLKVVVVAGGRILGRSWNKSLKSFPPWYSQLPLY
jgi:hypothetical protein